MYKVSLVNTTSPQFIPLALHYLKVVVEHDAFLSENCRVQIVEPSKFNDIQETASEIVSGNPDLVGFSMYVWTSPKVIEISKEIKRLKPSIKIVVGGPDVTPVAKPFLQSNRDWIDFVVMGEGEFTFKELVQTLSCNLGKEPNLNTVEGLCFTTSHNDVVQTQRRHIISELDQIPSPYLTGSVNLESENRMILLETYRGCPFVCTYCYYPKDFGKLIHSFSLERIEEELKVIFSKGISSILLMDPTFNIPPERAKKILRLIAKYIPNSQVNIGTELRVDLLDSEMIELLRKANFRVVELGLQSSDKEVLKITARTQNLNRITQNVEQLQSVGIEVVTQMIAGLPKDTFEKYLDSIDYAVSLKSTKIEIYRLQLLPGTPMYGQTEKLGLAFEDTPPRTIKSTPTMTEAEIDRCMRLSKLIVHFYNKKNLRLTYQSVCKKLGISFAHLLSKHLEWIDVIGWDDFVTYMDLTESQINKNSRPTFEAKYSESKRYIMDFFISLVERDKALERVLLELLRLDYYLATDFNLLLKKTFVLDRKKDILRTSMIPKIQVDYNLKQLLAFEHVPETAYDLYFVPNIKKTFLSTNNGFINSVVVVPQGEHTTKLGKLTVIDPSFLVELLDANIHLLEV